MNFGRLCFNVGGGKMPIFLIIICIALTSFHGFLAEAKSNSVNSERSEAFDAIIVCNTTRILDFSDIYNQFKESKYFSVKTRLIDGIIENKYKNNEFDRYMFISISTGENYSRAINCLKKFNSFENRWESSFLDQVGKIGQVPEYLGSISKHLGPTERSSMIVPGRSGQFRSVISSVENERSRSYALRKMFSDNE